MFGSHRLLLLRHIGPLLLSDIESCLSGSIFLFFSKTAAHSSDPGIDFFFCSVFEV